MSTTHDLPPVSDPAATWLADVDDQSMPARVGPYRVTALIGRGGMGVVYRAEQENPERPVALKMLPAERDNAALRRRFEHETAVLARLSHPGIARIFTAGVADAPDGGRPYFAMELVEGRPLTTYAREAELGVRERVELVIQLCDAVQHAHQQGVVHRDLKPGNVLVDSDGRVKILDFGIAKLVTGDTAEAGGETRVGDVVGTLEYMSPEQARGRPDEVDTRSDVYAVGVILYQLLAGRLPFDFTDRTPAARLDAIINEEPATLGTFDRSLRGDLETIVAKAMDKDRNRRYPSVSELAADLRRYLADEPVLARPASSWYLLAKFARKRKPLVVGVGLAVVAVVAAAVVSSLFWLSEREERKRKEAAEQEAASATRETRDLLIKTASERGDWRGVVAATDQALAAGHPDTPRLRLDQIRALHYLGDPRATGIAEALSARQGMAAAERAECDLLLGDLLLFHDEVEGRRYLRRALSGPLRPADRHYIEGVLAESFREASDHFKAAVEADPFHHGVRVHLGFLLAFSGWWEEVDSILDTGEAMFPKDPNFLILRAILAALRGDERDLAAASDGVRAALGEKAAKDLALATANLRNVFSQKGTASQLQVMQVQGQIANLKLAMGQDADGPLLRGGLMPPVLEKNHVLLSQAFTRFRDPKYADELGAAAASWPDVIMYKAWGDCLMIQGRVAEAAKAYGAGRSARTIFSGQPEALRLSHILVLWMLQGGAGADEKKRMWAEILADVRILHARYHGPGATALKEAAPGGQSVGKVLSEMAAQSGETGLARDILAEWRTVDGDNPDVYAQTAILNYYSGAYRRAIDAALEAKARGLKDPVQVGNVEFILREAPRLLRQGGEAFPAWRPDTHRP